MMDDPFSVVCVSFRTFFLLVVFPLDLLDYFLFGLVMEIFGFHVLIIIDISHVILFSEIIFYKVVGPYLFDCGVPHRLFLRFYNDFDFGSSLIFGLFS